MGSMCGLMHSGRMKIGGLMCRISEVKAVIYRALQRQDGDKLFEGGC